MKEFKTIDVIVQILLIIGFSIQSIISMDQTFLIGYFVVGGWQVTSMIVHHVNKWHTRHGNRRFYYHRISAAILIAMAAGFVVPYLLIVWGVMLFVAPVMAIYYLAICCKEVFYPAKRPLELI